MRNKRSWQRLLPILACSLCFFLPLKSKAANWQWVQNGTKLQYLDLDSTASDQGMLRSTFHTINGHTYYFDADGSVHTGWLYLKKDAYFFLANGAMVKNDWVGNYYFTKSGKMAKNRWIGGKKNGRYVGRDGRWIPNYNKKKNARFVTNKKGTRYRMSDGAFAKKQWLCIRGHWYYFYSNGYLAKDRKIGKYYVNKKGQMVINRWVRTEKYRIHYGTDGKMDKKIPIKNKKK